MVGSKTKSKSAKGLRGDSAECNTRKVEHNYHDHANETEDDQTPEQRMQIQSSASVSKNEQNFPVKLHYMLSDMAADGLDHIVSWQPHGRCFVVHKQKEFVEHILPLWFRQSKFPSFQRQLNLYGFKRLTTGRDKGGYYHELFLRGKRFLSHRIERIKVKGTGARKPSSPETEPNLYLIPFLPPSQPEPTSANAPLVLNNCIPASSGSPATTVSPSPSEKTHCSKVPEPSTITPATSFTTEGNSMSLNQMFLNAAYPSALSNCFRPGSGNLRGLFNVPSFPTLQLDEAASTWRQHENSVALLNEARRAAVNPTMLLAAQYVMNAKSSGDRSDLYKNESFVVSNNRSMEDAVLEMAAELLRRQSQGRPNW